MGIIKPKIATPPKKEIKSRDFVVNELKKNAGEWMVIGHYSSGGGARTSKRRWLAWANRRKDVSLVFSVVENKVYAKATING